MGRDFLSATGAPEHLAALVRRLVLRLRDEPRTAALPLVRLVVLLLALQGLQGEWVPLPAQLLSPAQQAASPPSEPLQGLPLEQEQALSAQLVPSQARRPQAQLARTASPPAPAQLAPQVRSVSLQRVPRSLASEAQAPQRASGAPLWPPPLSLLFPPWLPFPLALRLGPRPECACALFQRHPPGSNSSASSSP